jgi:hypothetical protein
MTAHNSLRTLRLLSGAVLCVIGVILLLQGGVGAAPAAATQQTVSFGMPYLECFQTTEAGEDEIYLVVSGKWHTGSSFSYRFPNESGHWSLNDREGDPPVRNQTLLNLPMRDGDVVDLVVVVMEEDGGSVGGWAALASTALGFLDPTAGSIAAALGRLLPHDSDDVIGTFSVHIEQSGGQAFAKFTPRDRTYNYSDPSAFYTKYRIDMNGDGSDYVSLFSVTP